MNFAERIQSAIEQDRQVITQLADEFAVAPASVKRWGRGVVSPHPTLQEDVLQFLDKLESNHPRK